MKRFFGGIRSASQNVFWSVVVLSIGALWYIMLTILSLIVGLIVGYRTFNSWGEDCEWELL